MTTSKFYFRKYYSPSHIFWKLWPRGFQRRCSKLSATGSTYLQISYLKCRKYCRCIVLVPYCKYSNNPLQRMLTICTIFLRKSYNLPVLHKSSVSNSYNIQILIAWVSWNLVYGSVL